MDVYLKPGDSIYGYSIVKRIGEGRYGIAYLALDLFGRKYLVKQLKEEMFERSRASLFYEEELLKHLHASCFPKFVDKFYTKGTMFYVLEYIEGTTFANLIHDNDEKFYKPEIYSVGLQLLEIIQLLQKNGIVHRDIRPPNVIRQRNNELVLIDFGLARYLDNHDGHSKQIDYWYLGDFLLHLLYVSYYRKGLPRELPWSQELRLSGNERLILRKLMGIEKPYRHIEDIRQDLLFLQANT